VPSIATFVGPLAIPVVPGAADAPILDPTVAGLLDYLAYWSKLALDPVLATMTAPPVPDTCPVANRFAVNPAKLVQRFSRPALFLWWDNKSIVRPFTTTKDVRQRDLQALYVFDRITTDTINGNDAPTRYAGLIGALDAAWARAVSRRNHPQYALPGFRVNTPIAVQLALNDLKYLGGQEGALQELVTASARAAAVTTVGSPAKLQRGSANGILQVYPCLRGVFRVVEEVGVDTPQPSDLTPDVLFQARVAGGEGDPNDPLDLSGRYLPATDAIDPDEEP
jgi:hypothetical protein